jgi:predicted RNA-binding protein with PUA-like domain
MATKKVASKAAPKAKTASAELTPLMAMNAWALGPRAEGETRYWLMKSEPDVFSIDDLKRQKTTSWENVRNYQARNYMTQGMKLGDRALYYHSNAEPSGIAGVCEIVKLAYPDPTQFDRKSEYFDEGATKEAPRWFMVDVGFVERFEEVLSLEAMKVNPALDGMLVLQKGTRLSITPVTKAHFDAVLAAVKSG